MIKIYRLIMTALCFAIFNLGGLCLFLIWFHFLNLFIKDKITRQNLARKSISLSFRLFIKILELCKLIKLDFINEKELLADQGCIIACNHPSLIDYVILASRLQHINCVVKESLVHNFFLKGVIKSANYLVNNDPEKILNNTKESLDRKECLLIFPEGTRTKRNSPIKLHRGAATLAVKLNVPLRIVTIACSEEFLSKEKKWYQVPKHIPCYTITVQEKLQASLFAQNQEELSLDPLLARRLNRCLTEVFQSIQV